jgi:hypothetical protein
MRYTIAMKARGEMAMRMASEEAWEFYLDTDPLEVYEYEDADGRKLYSYEGGGLPKREGLTFEELEEEFEEMYEVMNGTSEEC